MYQKLKNHIKSKIIQVASNVASEVATKISSEQATRAISDMSNLLESSESKTLKVANMLVEEKTTEAINNLLMHEFSDINEKLAQSTHIIFELLKYIKMTKKRTKKNLWEEYSTKSIGLWLGGDDYLVKDKQPIERFFGGGINCILGNMQIKVIKDNDALDNIEVVVFWGQSSHIKYLPLLHLIVLKQKEILFVEDGFIYNIISHTKSLTNNFPKEYSVGMSFTIDDITAHFDGSIASRLEQMIASNYELSELEFSRAKKLIRYIVENNITKYNYQSLDKKVFGNRKQKVLVVDQAYGDYSVYKSGATEEVFSKMLNDALLDNPDADVLVKIHPDMIANPHRAGAKNGGYFYNMELNNPRVILIKEELNPYTIINQIEKTYVCTSQLGFESLMAGKEVITYGIPFYAGWGVTTDRGKGEGLKRRNMKTRTVEELFWFAYIWYSRYYNPISMEKCEIEEVLKFITENRTFYKGMKSE